MGGEKPIILIMLLITTKQGKQPPRAHPPTQQSRSIPDKKKIIEFSWFFGLFVLWFPFFLIDAFLFAFGVVLRNTGFVVVWWSGLVYARSPRIRRASWMSLGMIVTRLAWIAHKLVSSNRPTRYASDASCSAITADDWKRRSVL